MFARSKPRPRGVAFLMRGRLRPGIGCGVFVCVLAIGIARADIPLHADLDSLEALALRNNGTLRSLEATHRAGLEQIPQAGALPDPMLNLMSDRTPVRRPSPTEAETYRIGVTQMFPFPGKQDAMRSMAAAEAGMAEADLERARLEVRAQVQRAYYDLYLLHASLEVREENQTALRLMAETARARYVVGAASQPDLLKANVELAMEANEIATMRREIPAAEARVNAIVNRAAGTPVGRPFLPDTSFAAPPLYELERRALAAQPMLRMKGRAIEAGEAGRRLAAKEGLPDFTVGLEYMAEREMPDEWGAMLGVSLPIWRGKKVAPMRREADWRLAAARAERGQAESEILFMVREAEARLSSARTRVHLYASSVLPQAQESLASARAAYTTGRVDFLDLLDAQRSLLRARVESIEAVVDYLKSQSDLRLAVGDPALGRSGEDE